MPVPPHFYAKQKLFSKNYSISFIFAFQEHQKWILKASRKAKMQINFWLFNFYRHSAGLDIIDVPTANYSCANLLKHFRMLKCQGGWTKNSVIHYEMSGAVSVLEKIHLGTAFA